MFHVDSKRYLVKEEFLKNCHKTSLKPTKPEQKLYWAFYIALTVYKVPTSRDKLHLQLFRVL